MSVDSRNISVVVQGAVDAVVTQKCLKAVRRFLPEAELILSTWKSERTEKLDADCIVLSEDPGQDGYCFKKDNVLSDNTNRQLRSVQAGLERCSRQYTLKLRSDFYISGARFLDFFDAYDKRSSEFLWFRHRVLVCSVFSRRFSDETGFPVLFHPSDWFFFGLTEDIRDYFCRTPLVLSQEDVAYKFPDRKPYSGLMKRYAPEQYFCISWVRRHNPEIQFDDMTDWSMEKLSLSDSVLFNNFIFLDPKQLALCSKKHDTTLISCIHNYGIITNAFFESEYRRRFLGYGMPYESSGTKGKERYGTVKIMLKPVRPFVRAVKYALHLFLRFWEWCG